MTIQIPFENQIYEVMLSNGHCIAIGQSDHHTPIAWYAPPFEAKPHVAGSFVGSLDAGAPVNFYDVQVNPHGNGTHTETMRHIDNRGLSIHDCLQTTHSIAQLITVDPHDVNGDRIVTLDLLSQDMIIEGIDSIIIRTLPNETDKLLKNYSGTNPCYFDYEVAAMLRDIGIKHWLVDTPSVDREEDKGELLAHHNFWNTAGEPRLDCTISEMIYVEKYIADDLYFLDIGIAPFELDVSPSRPMIYPMIAR